MMQLSFDLISDLHLETWEEKFNWNHMPTSTICVVAGDISRDKMLAVECLAHLANLYNAVIYIDGNDEHKNSTSSIEQSIYELYTMTKPIPNLYFLKETVTVIDGVAFIGCNGWWTYDFVDPESYDLTKQWAIDRLGIDMQKASEFENLANRDTSYISRSIEKLQTHPDVKQIVVISHTVPCPSLVEHDVEIEGTHILNSMGNSRIINCLRQDTEGKIHTWCFGHYHGGSIDQLKYGVRFVSNPKGRGNTKWCNPYYYPKRIVIDY